MSLFQVEKLAPKSEKPLFLALKQCKTVNFRAKKWKYVILGAQNREKPLFLELICEKLHKNCIQLCPISTSNYVQMGQIIFSNLCLAWMKQVSSKSICWSKQAFRSLLSSFPIMQTSPLVLLVSARNKWSNFLTFANFFPSELLHQSVI